MKIACLEEIGLYKGWLTLGELEQTAKEHGSSTYGKYLTELIFVRVKNKNASTHHDALMNKLACYGRFLLELRNVKVIYFFF